MITTIFILVYFLISIFHSSPSHPSSPLPPTPTNSHGEGGSLVFVLLSLVN